MKFGLILPNFGAIAGADAIRQSAILAEELGFDSVWTTDHVLMPASMPDPYGNLVESLIALSLAAAVTRRVQLGTSIIVTPQREPVLLAKQLASIDAISGGRLILGAGVGWLEQEFAYLNADYATRGARFDEGLSLARALWGGKGSFSGDYTTIDEALFSPYPVRGSDLPIWIGGNSRARDPPRGNNRRWLAPGGLDAGRTRRGRGRAGRAERRSRGHRITAHQYRAAGRGRNFPRLPGARSRAAGFRSRHHRRTARFRGRGPRTRGLVAIP